jgi:hypothetical protein
MVLHESGILGHYRLFWLGYLLHLAEKVDLRFRLAKIEDPRVWVEQHREVLVHASRK